MEYKNNILQELRKFAAASRELTESQVLHLTSSNQDLTALFKKLTKVDLEILSSLTENLRIKDLTEKIDFTQSAISKAVKRLENLNLVNRLTNQNNKKEFFIERTEIGQQLAEIRAQYRAEMNARFDQLVVKFDEKELKTIEKFLTEINKNVY